MWAFGIGLTAGAAGEAPKRRQIASRMRPAVPRLVWEYIGKASLSTIVAPTRMVAHTAKCGFLQ